MSERRKLVLEKMLKFSDICVFTVGLLSLWHIDIAISALLVEDVVITNGWTTFPPVKRYHMALWAITGAFVWFMARSIGVLDEDVLVKISPTRNPRP